MLYLVSSWAICFCVGLLSLLVTTNVYDCLRNNERRILKLHCFSLYALNIIFILVEQLLWYLITYTPCMFVSLSLYSEMA